eukprot:Awhi_evm1s7290
MTIDGRFVGLWKRSLEEEPIGTTSDTTTNVYWLQTTSGVYADLRIPSSCISGRSLEDLVKIKSFSGYVNITGNRVTWVREIDYHPPTGFIDYGDCTFKESRNVNHSGDKLTQLIEIGDGYLEIWDKVSNGCELGTAAFRLSDQERKGIFVFCDRFALRIVSYRNGNADDSSVQIRNACFRLQTENSPSLAQFLNGSNLSIEDKLRLLSDFESTLYSLSTNMKTGTVLYSTKMSLQNKPAPILKWTTKSHDNKERIKKRGN